MSAVDYARTVAPHEYRGDPGRLEAEALALVPEYAARVQQIVDEHGDTVRGSRSMLLARLRDEDPIAARTIAPPVTRGISLIAAYLAAAGVFAFFFSRADFELAGVTPFAMSLALLSSVLYLFAALPVRRSVPPTPNVATAAWVLALLTGAGVGFGGHLVLRFAPEVAGWLVVGALAVGADLAVGVACVVARRGLTTADRAETERRIKGFPDVLRGFAADEQRAATEGVRSAWELLSADQRQTVTTDIAAAKSVLAERGIDPADLADPPGSTKVAADIALTVYGAGVRGL